MAKHLIETVVLWFVVYVCQTVFVKAQGPVAKVSLPLGDIQVVSLTDTHSWVGGHGTKEHQFDADYGDVLSFYIRLKAILASDGRDLFFVFNGDFLDGTGLTREGDPSYVARIEGMMPYDALTTGNHELYRADVLEKLSSPSGFFEKWSGRYLTSNVVFSHNQMPVGARYRVLKGSNSSVLVYGFLYNMQNHSPYVSVRQVETVVREAWFEEALKSPGIDAVLVLAHMGSTDSLVEVILQGIRRVAGSEMPVQFINGHTHKRRNGTPDPVSASFEGGCFLDTVGFTAFPKISTVQRHLGDASVLFQHAYLDASREGLRRVLGVPTLDTPEGKAVSKAIASEKHELGLDKVVGCADRRYVYYNGLHMKDSLWGLYIREVVPRVFDENALLFLGVENFRYDLLPGKLVLDEIIAIAPFNETLYAFKNIPGHIMLKLNQTENDSDDSEDDDDYKDEDDDDDDDDDDDYFYEYLPELVFAPAAGKVSRTLSYDLITSAYEASWIREALAGIYPNTPEPIALNMSLLDTWLQFFDGNHLCSPTKAGTGQEPVAHGMSGGTRLRPTMEPTKSNSSFERHTVLLNTLCVVLLLSCTYLLKQCITFLKSRSTSSSKRSAQDMKALLKDSEVGETPSHATEFVSKGVDRFDAMVGRIIMCGSGNPDFARQALKFCVCFFGIQVAYISWAYLQELIMTTDFVPTPQTPNGKFPSATFCVLANRSICVLVGLVAVRLKHGAFFSNNKAPLAVFTPCALSNTISSWSQYASLRYVSFPVQNVFKSSKIIPVMIMGRILQGTVYPTSQYIEAFLITVGVAIFTVLSNSNTMITEEDDDDGAQSAWVIGLAILVMFICADSFTSQWQSRIYTTYGREHVDPYQMMLGVNLSSLVITSCLLLLSGDLPVIGEFLVANPTAIAYNVWIAISSAVGQIFIFYTIKEFGPIVFTVIMTTRNMISICISAAVFGHTISPRAASGAVLVFGVLFYQIWTKYYESSSSSTRSNNGRQHTDENKHKSKEVHFC